MAEIFHPHFSDPFSCCLFPSACLNRSVVPVIRHRCRLSLSTTLQGCAAIPACHLPEPFWQGESPAVGLDFQIRTRVLDKSQKWSIYSIPRVILNEFSLNDFSPTSLHTRAFTTTCHGLAVGAAWGSPHTCYLWLFQA